MPTYAYRCNACGHAFDIHQSFSDDSLTVCPECQGQLRKMFGAVGVTFNGSGFYRNDSRASGASKSAASSSGAGSSSSGSSTSSGSGSSSSSSSTSSSSSSSSSGSSSSGSGSSSAA